jgi:dTMP kinase
MPPAPHSGFFLTFEGLDGSGKTTQIKRLGTWLTEQNLPHILTRQPGGTATGDRIRELLLDSKSRSIAPMTELSMMFADRAQAIHEVIAPALASGKIVVCDRFTDSTEAYQGGGRQLGSEIVLQMHRLICGDLNPNLTILLLPDLKASLSRARRRNTKIVESAAVHQDRPDENRFEQEQFDFFQRVADKYREIAAREPLRVVIVDGDHSIEEVHRQVITAVAANLKTQPELWPAPSKTRP